MPSSSDPDSNLTPVYNLMPNSLPTPSLTQIQSLLRAFIQTSNKIPLKLIHSIPSPPTPTPISTGPHPQNIAQADSHIHSSIPKQPDLTERPPTTLLILDSSFNPPTKAHAYLVREAVHRLSTQQRKQSTSAPTSHDHDRDHGIHHDKGDDTIQARILLLLSTKNADKPSAPAAVEHRLMMMVLFAMDLWREFSRNSAASASGSGSTSASAIESNVDLGSSSDSNPDPEPRTDKLATTSAASSSTADSASIAVGTAPKSQPELSSSYTPGVQITGIDVALSSEPRFLEKSTFLSSTKPENPYSSLLDPVVSAEHGKDTSNVGTSSSGSDHDYSVKENHDIQNPDSEPESKSTTKSHSPSHSQPGLKPKNIILPQWHLLGFDTLIRLLDPKYYPPDGDLAILAPLFEGAGRENRILVFRRDEDEQRDQDEQRDEQGEYIKDLGQEHASGSEQQRGDGVGLAARNGWNAAWAEKIELVDAFVGTGLDVEDGNASGKGKVSSTIVRAAAKEDNAQLVERLCGENVGRYVVGEQLYTER